MRNITLWKQDFDRTKNYIKDYPEVAKIFQYPNSIWLTGRKTGDSIKSQVSRIISRAGKTTPTIVVYAIPGRDLGSYSAGGLSYHEYLEYCRDISQAIGNSSVILIIEPDALIHSVSLGQSAQLKRLHIIQEAVGIFAENRNALVYIDAGHPGWFAPEDVKPLLKKAGIKSATGFAINVSNYRTTVDCLHWGNKLTELFNGKKTFVIDTSRNGKGPYKDMWCNPPERGIGELPTILTGEKNCDAFLWIKVPGESDGKCNGGPKAGKFWPEQAVSLVKNSSTLGNS